LDNESVEAATIVLGSQLITQGLMHVETNHPTSVLLKRLTYVIQILLI